MIQPDEHLLRIHRTIERMSDRRNHVCLERNERTIPFSPEVLRDMLSMVQSETLNQYPDPAPLYQRLSATVKVPQDHLYLTNGSDAAIRMLFQTFVRPGDHILFADPSYAMYAIYTQIFQGEPLTVPYGSDLRLQMDDLLALIRTRPRLVVLANPDQPTGAVLEPAFLRKLATTAKAAGDILLVIDEAYYPFYPETAADLVRQFDNVVVTRTFSKAGGLAGLRLGYMAAPLDIIRAVSQIRGAHEVNAMAIAMGCYMLDHPEVSRDFVRILEEGREVLQELARRHQLLFPSCPTNFQLIGFPEIPQTTDIVNAIKSKGYLVKGGFAANALHNYIRVTLADVSTMKGFSSALEAVLKEVSWTPR